MASEDLLKNAVTDPVLEMAQRILDMRDGKAPPLFPRVEGRRSVTIRYGVWEDDLFALATAALQNNTRPAPAATDTGLETVGEVSTVRESIAAFAGHMLSRQLKPGDLLCRRSQAEELLAAEREKALFLKAVMETAQTHCGLKDKTIASLEADNAAQAARIEELETERDTSDKALFEQVMTSNETLAALEAKLAAAEEALEPFAAVLEDYDPDWEDDDVTAVLVDGSVTHYGITLGDFRKARAVLGGEPS